MKSFWLILVALLVGVASADVPPSLQGPPIIDAREQSTLRDHLGQRVIVTGTIDKAEWSRSGKVMIVTFKGVPDTRFSLASFSSTRDAFDGGFAGNVAKALQSSKVRIKGIVEPYGGRDERMKDGLQILLRYPNQITILELDPS
jgi:hypothetical protein